MKKLAIPFVVGITIGLGASTGAAILMGGEPETLEDSLAAALEHEDSAHAAAPPGAVGDITDHGAEAAAPDTAHAGAAGHVDAGTDVRAGAAGPEEPARSSAAASASEPTQAMTSAELAKLFAAMQAREAARVLEHMEDEEVQVILGQLARREAAAILSNLSPERAAVISRTILRAERSAQ